LTSNIRVRSSNIDHSSAVNTEFCILEELGYIMNPKIGCLKDFRDFPKFFQPNVL